MAVSKGLRYEVLRRCNFACYYCGAVASLGLTEIHIEHVVPRALGGTDEDHNLVAACQHCNAGKGTTPPSVELLQRVRDDYCGYLSTQDMEVEPCMFCRLPVELFPGEDHSAVACKTCTEAFEAGMNAVRHLEAGV